ncbi:MAG: signal peptidase I [bacterium]|nr:signal peptidase I [bacterium]
MVLLRKLWLFLIDTIQTILLFASLFIVVWIFFFRPFQVNGLSMYPNFHDGEYVLTNLIVLRFGEPKRGDVVVFKAPTDQDKDFIKRVIGISGNTVSLKNGEVYLNDEKLDESAYLSESVKTYGGSFLRDGEAVTVPENSFFVMGDNRSNSSDSREWGFVNKTLIIGESTVVYWPINQTRNIKNPYK